MSLIIHKNLESFVSPFWVGYRQNTWVYYLLLLSIAVFFPCKWEFSSLAFPWIRVYSQFTFLQTILVRFTCLTVILQIFFSCDDVVWNLFIRVWSQLSMPKPWWPCLPSLLASGSQWDAASFISLFSPGISEYHKLGHYNQQKFIWLIVQDTSPRQRCYIYWMPYY